MQIPGSEKDRVRGSGYYLLPVQYTYSSLFWSPSRGRLLGILSTIVPLKFTVSCRLLAQQWLETARLLGKDARTR